jgi:hypothetical protein
MPLRTAAGLAGLFAAVTFLIHIASSLWGTHLGYGFYRDEFYYLDCGRRLAFGYVDHPPLVALQARLAELLFGVSPTGVRIFSFLGGGVIVGLTGLLAWEFGADRRTQILAMTGVMAAPLFLGVTNFLSMNAIEPCFWMGALFFVLRLAEGTAGPYDWIFFGLLTGLGIENKHSTVFFLVALTVGLLLTPQRRILFTRQCAAAVVVILLVALPNLLWQVHNHFPTYQFLERVRESDKNVRLSVPLFLYDQVKVLLYSTFPLWFGGLLWLAFSARARRWRFVAITYVVFVSIMIVLGGKYYYLGPIYPVLFAAGAVAFAQIVLRPRWINAYSIVLGLTVLFITGPITLTVLPPARYNALTGIFSPDSVRMEKFTSPLPEVLSDRFGWPEMVQGFASRYNALPPEVRAGTAIFCDNYGEAGAVDILGPKYGLPAAIGGHQNYFFWGWNDYNGDSVLTLGDSPSQFTGEYAEVIDLGAFDSPWTMDYERRHFYLLRYRKQPFAASWEQVRYWY